MAQPPLPERTNASGGESLPLDQSPMLRFRSLATKLIAVSKDELADVEEKHKQTKGLKKE